MYDIWICRDFCKSCYNGWVWYLRGHNKVQYNLCMTASMTPYMTLIHRSTKSNWIFYIATTITFCIRWQIIHLYSFPSLNHGWMDELDTLNWEKWSKRHATWICIWLILIVMKLFYFSPVHLIKMLKNMQCSCFQLIQPNMHNDKSFL